MAAQTYRAVDLADERVREGDLNRRLADVGERLATAGSTEEVVATLAASAAEVVGARSAAVGVLDAGRGILHMVDDEREEGWTTSLSDQPQDPSARAVDTERAWSRRDLLRMSELMGGPSSPNLSSTIAGNRSVCSG